MRTITFSIPFKTVSTIEKENRQGICALIRLMYIRGVYQSGDDWLISNRARFEKYALKHDIDNHERDKVYNLLSNLREIDWNNISLNDYCAICVIFNEARLYAEI